MVRIGGGWNDGALLHRRYYGRRPLIDRIPMIPAVLLLLLLIVDDDDDDGDEDDDDDGEEEMDEEARMRQAELAEQREDIAEMEKSLKELQNQYHNMQNPILRKRLETNIENTRTELSLKKAAFQDQDEI